MAEYRRFKADCWTVNFNYEAIACITSQSDDELIVDGILRTNSDMIGLYWTSEDFVKHDLLKYPTDKDYTGVKLNFDFETINWNYLGGSSLTIKHEDGNSYFVYPPRLANNTVQTTQTFNNNNGNFKLNHYNVLQEEVTVTKGNTTKTGYANINLNWIIDENKNIVIFVEPTKNTKLVYSTSYKSLKQTYGYNEQYTKKTLPDDNIIAETLFVTDSNDNPLHRGTWEQGEEQDYVYDPTDNTIQPQSQTCANGCKVYYVTYGELDDPTLHATLDYNAKWDRVKLSDSDILEDTLIVKDLEGNTLERGANDWSNPKDYVYFHDTHELQPQSNRCANGCKVYYKTVNEALEITVNIPDNTYRYTIPKKINHDSPIRGNNVGRGEIVQDKDYYLDLKQCELRMIDETLLTGGTITYEYATSLEIDFDNLTASSYKEPDETLIQEEVHINPVGIEHILIPIVPLNFIEKEYTIMENQEVQFRMYNMEVTNDFLGYEPEFNVNHNYRLAEGYDDAYNYSPRRLAYMDARLGYKEWLDFYIGASHFYEKSGTIGENARPGVDLDKDLNALVVDSMVLDKTVDINMVFETWFDDYVRWSKYYDVNNFVVSISLENLQPPDEWKQLLWDGTPGKTGWTPATKFYSPTNMECRDYIRRVAEACLDILVEHDMTPILQWGEPWWWWQELYPEAISNDPDKQESNIQKYPGQPPAFYDQATKDKYFAETGKQLPVYKTSRDDYDEEVIGWLRNQLVEYSNFMRDIAKSYEGGLYTALYFPPYIFDTDRVPPMMQGVNYPADAWNNGQLDFLQLEDYDWVIDDDAQHDEIWTFGQKLNIPNHKIHYFSGYCQYPINAPREWALIKQAAEEGIRENMAEVYLWSGTQVRRDNIIMNAPLKPVVRDDNAEIAIPLVNIIILSPDEKVIRWLISDITDISEENAENTVRKITLTYPLDDETGDTSQWYVQGNKIFIPKVFGLENCLYVINTSYTIDYWDDNTVVVEAEEVLTELNNMVTAVYDENNKINATTLKAWFGKYYIIDQIDALDGAKDSISSIGTVTLMTLLRTIEEKTERVFITRYVYTNNKIYRYLSLLKEDTLRQSASTEYLDLNYNLESLELEVDEEKVYGGMAPLFNIQEKMGTESSDYVNWNNSNTSVDAITTADSKEVYKAWLDLQVGYREYIPMIRQKEADGTVITKSSWYAPFEKRKGELHIENVAYANSIYNHIQPPAQNSDSFPNPVAKIGTVSTSETDPYAIYNVLANSLLDKLSTKYTLKIKVKDIADLYGIENLSYNLYETLYVKVPGFDYYIPGHITKTVKNLHLPGEDSITVETDVKTTHITQDTTIESNNKIIESNESNVFVGGILKDENNNPVQNELVTVSVRLVEAYANSVNITQSILPFQPEKETYQFSKEMIWELEKNLRYNKINSNFVEYFVLTDVTGKSYLVPHIWCLAIYFTMIQIFINTDRNLGDGVWRDTIEVHYYPDNKEQLKKTGLIDYYPSRFYDIAQILTEHFHSMGIPNNWLGICSNEIQNGSTCVASAVSNATAYLFNYKTEGELLKMMNKSTTSGFTADEMNRILLPTLRNLGYDVNIVQMTEENIKKYVGRGVALLGVDPGYLPAYPTTSKGTGHEILLYEWYTPAGGGVTKCYYFDSNHPVMSPSVASVYDVKTANCLAVEDLIRCVHIDYVDGKLETVPLSNRTKAMIVISPTVSQSPQNMKILTPPANYVIPNSTENNENSGGE